MNRNSKFYLLQGSIRRTLLAAVVMLVCCLFAGSANAAGGLTPAQAVNKGATTLVNAKGIKVVFSIKSAGHNANGTLISKGSKFMLDSPMGSSWFNGSALYTYNPRTQETTVVRPSASELSEANPLSYIYADHAFTARDLAPAKGKRVISLTPNKKGLGVKMIVLTLNPTTCLPEEIKITADNGASTSITVKSLQLDVLPDARVFEYPKNKFPKAEIIDMR